MVWSLRWLVLPITVLQFSQAQAALYKGPFTGVFYGQYEGCWGELAARTRTIAWDVGNASCRRTIFTMIDQNMHAPFENYDHIVFRLHYLSSGCPFPYIGLYFYQPASEAVTNSQVPESGRRYNDWWAVGFESYKQYKTFPYKGFLDGKVQIDPQTLTYCAFSFWDKPFPYGIPVG